MSRDFLEEWHWRQIVQDVTKEEEVRAYLKAEPRTVYAGFDPTADSLHVGSLLPLLALSRLQKAGHRPIVLVGGGTGLIGDPSGKQGERTLNSADVVAEWSDKLRRQMSRFVDFECGDLSVKMVNNYDWLSSLNTIEFLRDVGKHFAVGAMLGKESVRSRINREGAGISYTEFSYMILQAYDFLNLFREHGCSIQIGGSDQWGNITAGIDLIRRLESKPSYGITLPLVVKSDGTKFGKTEDGTVWLDAEKTSPYEMYQFWLNTADIDTGRFLRYFTFLSQEEVQALEKAIEEAPQKREAQRRLAEEVTALVHGKQSVLEAEQITAAFFKNDISSLNSELLKQVPKASLEGDEFSVLDLLTLAELAPSKGQARRLVKGGGVSVNGEKISDANAMFSRQNALFEQYFVVRKGKKNYQLLGWD